MMSVFEKMTSQALDLFPDEFTDKQSETCQLRKNYIEVSTESPFTFEKLLCKDWKKGVRKVITYPLKHVKNTRISEEESEFFVVEGVDGKQYTFAKVKFNDGWEYGIWYEITEHK
jgi:hypothetical protein